MSFLFAKKSKTKPTYTGIQLQSASSRIPVALAGGLTRIAPNLWWYGDFTAVKHKEKVGKGGSSVTSYTYTASVILGLCQGPIIGVQRAWKDDGVEASYATLGFSLFTGTIPQTPWGYLTGAHPTQADGYPGGAYVAKAAYDLGSSAALPNHSFEVKGIHWATQVGGAGDADPALWVDSFLTNADWGALFPSEMLDLDALLSSVAASSPGDSAFQTYCRAMGFGISPAIVDQTAAGEILQRWCVECNTALVWTGFSLKLVPYGDAAVTGHGVTYLPPTDVRYALTNDDFIAAPGAPPVSISRSDPKDAYNIVKMVIRDRANAYNELPVPWQDDNAVNLYGRRESDPYDAPDVCDATMAATMVALYGNRIVYIRNEAHFTLPPRFDRLEPMDVVTITESALGYVAKPYRLESIEENDDGNLECVAEEFTGAVGTPGSATGSPATPTEVNSLATPGDVNPPILFEPPSTLAGDSPQVWAAVSGADANWGGAIVYVSTDNITYQAIGDIPTGARMGVTTSSLAAYASANPDTTHSVGVNLTESFGALLSATDSASAAGGATLSYIDDAYGGANHEFFSYLGATLTSAYHYTLGTELYRGLYGTTGSLHASGSRFARLDDNIFKFTLPAAYIGVPLWFKFQSYNIWGNATQDLAAVTAYAFTPAGTGFGGGPGGVPLAPTGLAEIPGIAQIALSWNANAASDNVTSYRVYRATGTGASFGSATLLAGAGLALGYTNTGLPAGTGYTYFLTAVNAVGESAPTAGVNATTSTTAIAVVRFYGSLDRKPDAGEELFDIEMKGDETFVAGFVGSLGSCDVAPAAAVTFDIQKNGVSVGSMNIALGATTATFTLASPLSFASGDHFALYAPSPQDATLSGPRYTFVGSR